MNTVSQQSSTSSDEFRLRQLGIELDDIRRAIHTGHGFWKSCTAHDPASERGIGSWGRTVRGLREALVPRGWRSERTHALDRVTSADGKTSVVVAAGDEYTGVRSGTKQPKSQNPRGSATYRAIVQNNRQRVFDFANPAKAGSTCTTWVLLYRRTDSEIHCELSLPEEMDDERITSWKERIVLPPILLEPPALGGAPDDGDMDPDRDDDGQIDISVAAL